MTSRRDSSVLDDILLSTPSLPTLPPPPILDNPNPIDKNGSGNVIAVVAAAQNYPSNDALASSPIASNDLVLPSVSVNSMPSEPLLAQGSLYSPLWTLSAIPSIANLFLPL